MEIQLCNISALPHLSAGHDHDGRFWVQVGDGKQILIAHLRPEEWEKWTAQLPAVSAWEQRAAVMAGKLMVE